MRNILLLLAVFISGCVSNIPQHSESEIKDRKMSLVKSRNTDPSFLSKEPLAAGIDYVYKSDGTEIFKKAAFGGGIGEIYVEPGLYYFGVRCQTGDTFSLPRLAVKIEAEKRYVLYCDIFSPGTTVLGIPKINEFHAHIEVENDSNKSFSK